VAEAYLDRVLVASVRERIAAARDGGPSFAVVLAQLDVDRVAEATRRAMIHRAIRATLGASATLLGGDVAAYRYGESGVAVLAPAGRDPGRGERLAALVRARLDELMQTMTSTVRAFGTARWSVRAGEATWSEDIGTTTLLLRRAERALPEGDRDLADAEAELPRPVGHVDLEGVAAGAHLLETDRLQHGPPVAPEPAGGVPNVEPEGDPGVDVPRLREQDLHRLHQVWLEITSNPEFSGLHHYHVVALALTELQRELHGPHREQLLGELREELRKEAAGEGWKALEDGNR